MDFKASLWLLGALVGTSCVAASAANQAPPSASDQAPAIAAFDRTYAGITDYTCILHVRESKGTQTQDRLYQYSFMNPHHVKMLILDGDGKGSGGVWIGGDEVSVHLGGILSGLHVKIGLHDPRVVSLRGVTIPDGLPPHIIDDYGTIPGKLTQTDGGKIGGIETDRLELNVADPASDHDITKQILYLSKETHWPIRQIMYSESQIVLDESVNDLKTNLGLTKSDFSF